MEEHKTEFVQELPRKSSEAAEDFGQMFEESLRSVRPGEVVHGRVVKMGSMRCV